MNWIPEADVLQVYDPDLVAVCGAGNTVAANLYNYEAQGPGPVRCFWRARVCRHSVQLRVFLRHRPTCFIVCSWTPSVAACRLASFLFLQVYSFK